MTPVRVSLSSRLTGYMIAGLIFTASGLVWEWSGTKTTLVVTLLMLIFYGGLWFFRPIGHQQVPWWFFNPFANTIMVAVSTMVWGWALRNFGWI